MAEVNMDTIADLLDRAGPILAAEPNYMQLPSDREIAIASDLHGDVESAKKFFQMFPDHLKVLLGDSVNKATIKFGSLQTIQLILEEKLKDPENVVLLRGDHEFANLFALPGRPDTLYLEISDALPEGQNSSVLMEHVERISGTFRQLPYVASTENGVLMLHGGLPDISDEDQLKSLPKGVDNYHNNAVIREIVWSDNVRKGDPEGKYIKRRSGEGRPGNLYGERFFSKIMGILGHEILVRGHDPLTKGYSLEGKILTVHTCQALSRYPEDANEDSIQGVYAAVLDPQKKIRTAKDLEIVHL